MYQILSGVFWIGQVGDLSFLRKRRKRGRFIDVIFENFEMFYGLLECSL